jgi:hypothetical protein
MEIGGEEEDKGFEGYQCGAAAQAVTIAIDPPTLGFLEHPPFHIPL